MSLATKIITGAAAAVVAGIVAFAVVPAVATNTAAPSPAEATPTQELTPATAIDGAADADAPLSDLPEWAKGTTWLIYPDGFECEGTEGCGNDYVAIFGEPGDVLPEGVEYYDPAKHDYNPATNTGFVFPRGHTLVVTPDQ
ncbi:hypothetical protein J2X03_000898 [Microbacterium trichothecenolyticum]|uniref:hypothetical protein n=1 Tax=Microbacterium trichothecenolyticum TaxID=69370 RepID=UPI002855E6D5|nr:hypothetical protein [Microbacterium trichothecenolyticum]MDR7111034.1 hypothetical protein [Microbacterium trichothecenolyticum]